MTTPSACPISYERVDHNASRVTCILTIVVLALISGLAVASARFGGIALLLATALALDYAIRAWTKWPSPMQRLARAFARALGIAEKPSDAAPKRFACRIGFFFALGTVVLLPLAPTTAVVLAVALLFSMCLMACSISVSDAGCTRRSCYQDARAPELVQICARAREPVPRPPNVLRFSGTNRAPRPQKLGAQ